jgi:hypothetical protein
MDDLTEWAFVIGFSLVLYSGIVRLRVWSMEQPPTSPASPRRSPEDARGRLWDRRELTARAKRWRAEKPWR